MQSYEVPRAFPFTEKESSVSGICWELWEGDWDLAACQGQGAKRSGSGHTILSMPSTLLSSRLNDGEDGEFYVRCVFPQRKLISDSKLQQERSAKTHTDNPLATTIQ